MKDLTIKTKGAIREHQPRVSDLKLIVLLKPNEIRWCLNLKLSASFVMTFMEIICLPCFSGLQNFFDCNEKIGTDKTPPKDFVSF